MKMKKLPKEFYTRDVVTVAKELLGKYFIKHENNFDYITKIVETEAYDGSIDEAAHTYIGMTERNKIMFNEGGYLYVYFTYGFHYCVNIFT
jgi:DNA-3-methyladenine glycosylase